MPIACGCPSSRYSIANDKRKLKDKNTVKIDLNLPVHFDIHCISTDKRLLLSPTGTLLRIQVKNQIIRLYQTKHLVPDWTTNKGLVNPFLIGQDTKTRRFLIG